MAATYNVETAASVAGPWIVDQKGVRAMCCVFLSWLDRTTVHFPSTVLHPVRHWDSALGLPIELYTDDVVAERERAFSF